jgi:hypothetical protein
MRWGREEVCHGPRPGCFKIVLNPRVSIVYTRSAYVIRLRVMTGIDSSTSYVQFLVLYAHAAFTHTHYQQS